MSAVADTPPPAPRPFAPGDWAFFPGGPTMRVVDVGRDTGLVFCRWVGKAGGPPTEGGFDPAALRRRHLPSLAGYDDALPD